MPIDLPSESREEAIASLQTYARQHFDEPMGNLAAGELLDFFLEEIGPSVYNKAVRDVKDRIEARMMELDVEVHQPEFTYWQRRGGRRA